MTTSNIHDLSSFEPEAILAAFPGEHPRMAAAIVVGREAQASGHLDIDELTRIANEIYAEGFPHGAPELPSTASLTDSAVPYAAGSPGIGAPVPPVPSAVSALPAGAPAAANVVPGIELAQVTPPSLGVSPSRLPPEFSQERVEAVGPAPAFPGLDISSLLGGVDIPYPVDLQGLLTLPVNSLYPHGSGNPGAGNASPYYFVAERPGIPDVAASAHPPFDVSLVRKDFPILSELVNGRPLIWLDNAATTQKPQAVIDRLSYFYQHENSNIHRAAHELAARATDAYEGARETVRRFINAPAVENIVFVRGTTEAINLVAKTWGRKHLGEGDEVVVTHLEHHANIVPWQQLCQETGAKLKVVPVDDTGQVLLDEYQKLLTSRTKLVSFTQVSNALGTVTPAREMIAMAHAVGAKVLLDGAQSVSHMRTDVQSLDCDFLVFSGHKIFGPTGIGALYGKAEVLDDMPAWQGGGNMIQDVTFEKTVYHGAPAKFEAGTGNIADAVGMGAALEYVERLGIENIARYEHELLVYATAALNKVPGLRLIGTAQHKASVLSFNLQGYKSEEVGAALNQEGIAVRSGHHCAQPILRRFGVEATVRPSLAFYNTYAEVDVLQGVLSKLASAKR
ncbi:family 2A encapsulin nanocompartment cargo protein cysteine desulfurase [Methylobacillus flagellatus]|uniref:Cysteine desulfurase n=1 Tax=Methylobacillus flagellatus (strain ATCC 51484 / DSM 6875 / VKM B-1610 / KT) TaxID=265072 RepID=Q1H3Q0_METFK|nr:family 2A encapsulin nanocompartment cargo protein cysteine desulfurase [Methylobacillus flagellatus]ABE48887.1 cysteine desulfurase [Methylobacillus flagellatus KT]